MADDRADMSDNADAPAFDRLAMSVGQLETLAARLSADALTSADRGALRQQIGDAITLLDRMLEQGRG